MNVPVAGPRPGEGVRLAKCVMTLARCSRREAEALIEAGAVLLDGVPVQEPARRVMAGQTPTLSADAQATLRTLDTPLTLLWHDDRSHLLTPAAAPSPFKPVVTGTPEDAHGRIPAWLTERLQRLPPGLPPPTPARLARLRPLLALLPGQAGLSVWSDDPAVHRRLQDRQRPLEQEWRLASPQPWTPSLLESLARAGWRASLTQQTADRWTYRLVGRSPGGPSPTDIAADSLTGPPLRLRIGALGLSPLAPGQARLLRPGEHF